MTRLVLLVLSLVSATWTTASLAADLPNGSLTVAYQQRYDNKLSDGVHQITLTCFDGRCSLTTVTVNQCVPGAFGGDAAFHPKAERTSTDEGDLTVTEVANGVLIAEERHSLSTFKYRLTYTTRINPDLAKTIRLRSTPRFFDGLKTFSGGAVKTSEIVGKVITWEFVPIKGAFAVIEPKCKIAVFGVPD